MIGKVKSWYAALSRREQVMVGVLGALVALTVLVYGMILPIGNWYDSANERYRLAVENSSRVMARLAVLERGGTRQVAGSGEPVNLVLATDASELGLELSSNQAQGNQSATIVIPSATPPAFFGWVAQLERQGIILQSLNMRPGQGGTVAINATFRRAG
jgi:general secretion pathway protein M